jgi:DNA mismatch endonuclease (patch repair protein)
MADRVSQKVRSRIMASVGTHDTGPEMVLRRKLHSLGFRYRTNYPQLPGRPDLAFPALRKTIFVHGCFWHGHGCRFGRLPKSRTEYWRQKIQANRVRDRRVLRAIRHNGWEALVVWQCRLRDIDRVIPRILDFLRKKRKKGTNSRVRVVVGKAK